MERCQSCNRIHARAASQAWIIDRVRAWADRFGDPPGAADWNRAPSIRARNPAAALRQDEASDEHWPALFGVVSTFGSWNNAIRAAGFQPMRAGQRRGE